MRSAFAEAMIALGQHRTDAVFLTADLGYLAVEGIEQALGRRFVNVGVAEQNAVSLAAGMAREGMLPWLYSMSAFTTMRPYAQIRDNVCLHELPVKLVGNGGGYGYGIMGATHHALEDLAIMRALPGMRLYLPLTSSDLAQVVPLMADDPAPNYLRLNRARGEELLGPVPPFAAFRRLKSGKGAIVLAVGPVVESLYEMGRPDLLDELEIWSVGSLPLEELPPSLLNAFRHVGKVITMEEHYQAGGLGEALSHRILVSGIELPGFFSLCAQGYPSRTYGSQAFHQQESGLRGGNLARQIEEVLRV